MTIYLDAAPFLALYAFAVDDKGAALDAAYLFAIHVFHLDDAKQLAGSFLGVGQQVERQAELGFEIGVRFDAVAGDAENLASQRLELRLQFTKLQRFRGAAGSRILGVKIDD